MRINNKKMMSTTEKELTKVYEVETIGEISKKFHMRIFIGINREFTDADKNAISDCATKLQEAISEQTYRLNPELQQNVIKDREEILACFAGNDIFVEEIPNDYSNSSYSKMFPWFVVTTKKGRIKIGWRKRVINIDWSDSIINKRGDELFAGEKDDTTVCEKSIHAWGYEKATEYIKVLLNS